MKNDDFQKKITDLQEKIGEEASSLILDDIGLLLSDNKTMNETLDSKDKEINDLKKRNESLMNVNANLLQQVPMGSDEDLEPTRKEEKKKEPFDFRSAFDEFGNFKV